jgi:F0F1-type ATP synthase delta subunit
MAKISNELNVRVIGGCEMAIMAKIISENVKAKISSIMAAMK